MVGLVLVSHSRKLAEAVRDLVLQMTAPGFPVAVAGGVGDNFDELGTDAVHIADVLQTPELPRRRAGSDGPGQRGAQRADRTTN